MGEIGKKVRNMSTKTDSTYRYNDTIIMSAVGRSKVFNIELVGLSICDPAYYVRRYNCRMYIFEYIYGGKGTVNVNGVSCAPVAGDVYILPQGSDHEYFTDKKEKWRKIWFTASGLLIEELLKAYSLTGVYWIQGIPVKQLFVDMFSMVKNQDPNQNTATALLLHKLVIEFAGHLNLHGNRASPDALAIKKYLDANLTRPICLEAIAARIHKSPSQTIRVFKKEYSVTPYEYVIRERINSAKMLLGNHPFLTVKEVAFMLNFSDEHYFSNVFRRRVGISPIMFKQMSLLETNGLSVAASRQ